MQYLEPEPYQADITALVAREAAYNEIIGRQSGTNRAVLLGGEEYVALMETVHLVRGPRVATDFLEAAGEDLEGSAVVEDVRW